MSDSDQPNANAPDPADLQCRFWGRVVFKGILAVLSFPYRRAFKLYTWKPLEDFRKADGDRRLLIPMVRDWKENKYEELHSVQIAASFCAGATLATISWTGISNPVWLSDALWFCSLICSIWAVITSIQTRSILDDIPNREQLTQRLPESELKRMRRVILRYKRTPGVGHWIMLFIWQFPSMTMSYAWCSFLTGLTLYVLTPFIRKDKWSDHHKIGIAYMVVFGLGFCTYLFSSIFVYNSEKAFLQSAANTRANTDTTDPEINAYPSSAALSEKPTLGRENRQTGQTLDNIPEDSDSDPVRRAQTLPLPDATNRPRALILPKRRFLI